MNKPNIFKYATKELSQDAFIFWLLDHANPKYTEIDQDIKNCAFELLQVFFELENKLLPEKIIEFQLYKQVEGIDILLKINDYYLIIEDKTSSKSHGNQLKRYRDVALKKANNIEKNILAIYFKTHDQSNYKKEINDGFKIFSRGRLISILNHYTNIKSDIFNDFKDHMNLIENEVNGFITEKKWTQKNWIGFFKYLQKELKRGDWAYVPNQNGGFMGYWWAFQKNELCTQYLQIQENELVLKINSNKAENDKKFRNICYQHFLEKATKEGLDFKKPAKFGRGETMTILRTDYIIKHDSSECVDLEKIVNRLKKYTLFLEKYALTKDAFL